MHRRDLGYIVLRSFLYGLEIEVKVKWEIEVLDLKLCYNFTLVHDKDIGFFCIRLEIYYLEKCQPEVTLSQPEVAIFALLLSKST